MVTFDKIEDYQTALDKEQILIGRTFCPFRKYVPKPHVIQCFNCYQFDHLAIWCTKKKACPYCAKQHKGEECNNRDEMKCMNCSGVENKHSSTSQNCPSYVAKLEAVSVYNNNYYD